MRIAGKANINALEKTYANSFAYTAAGAIAKLKLGNGLWEAAKFNERLQITELGLGIGADNLDKWKVNYDYGEIEVSGALNTAKNTGNIAKQTISFQGLTNPFVQTYKYDSLYRLKEARETNNNQQTWIQTFDYDRFGNRTSFSQNIGGQQLVLNNQNFPQVEPNTTSNRFPTGQGYTYDFNGNLVVDAQGRQFTFNGENKQTQVKDASNNIVGQYFYDGEGKRVKKVTASETTIFVYSGGKLIAEYSTLPPPTNPTTNYVATDILQSVRAISDANGQVISRRDFMPFGEELIPDGTHRKTDNKYLPEIDRVRQKFTGYQKDTETQLDFAEARMYENRHGRFTAVDPLLASGKSANPQTFNRYVYVGNNPVIRTAPNGEDWVKQTVTRVTYGRTFKTNIPVWISGNAAGKTAWTRGVYRVGHGNGRGLWTALDPYSSNFKQFKTRAEAVTAYNGFLSQRNADVIGGTVHAVTDTLDGASAISVARPVADAVMNAAGINPNESSEVYRTTNLGANTIITVGSVVGGEVLAAKIAARPATAGSKPKTTFTTRSAR